MVAVPRGRQPVTDPLLILIALLVGAIAGAAAMALIDDDRDDFDLDL